MEYEYVTARCAQCGKILYFKIVKLMWFIRATSGLGPNTIVCSRCRAENETPFKEWDQMSAAGRIWYAVLSLLYGAVIGFMVNIPLMILFDRVFPADEALQSTAAVLVVVFITLLIGLLQVTRILRSIGRTAQAKETKITAGIWNWETNLQAYGMAVILLSVLGGALTLLID